MNVFSAMPGNIPGEREPVSKKERNKQLWSLNETVYVSGMEEWERRGYRRNLTQFRSWVLFSRPF